MSPEVAVLLLATLPIFELRGSVPVGILLFQLPVAKTAIYSILGNMLPTVGQQIKDHMATTFLSEVAYVGEGRIEA